MLPAIITNSPPDATINWQTDIDHIEGMLVGAAGVVIAGQIVARLAAIPTVFLSGAPTLLVEPDYDLREGNPVLIRAHQPDEGGTPIWSATSVSGALETLAHQLGRADLTFEFAGTADRGTDTWLVADGVLVSDPTFDTLLALDDSIRAQLAETLTRT